MPKRRKFATLTNREIKALSNPASCLFIIGSLIGFPLLCAGISYMISFSTWLEKTLGISSSLAFSLSVFVIFAFLSITLVMIAGIYFFVTYKRDKEIERKFRAIQISNIDSMTGIDFEHYLQRLLSYRGFNTSVTKASGDLGVDLIASKAGDRIAIQAKRYDTKVSRRAISDAVAGMKHYGCNRAMVITNNYFTPDAIKLARSTGCILIDRNTLAKWIIEFRNAKQNKSA